MAALNLSVPPFLYSYFLGSDTKFRRLNVTQLNIYEYDDNIYDAYEHTLASITYITIRSIATTNTYHENTYCSNSLHDYSDEMVYARKKKYITRKKGRNRAGKSSREKNKPGKF